jgi:hypothetical protein
MDMAAGILKHLQNAEPFAFFQKVKDYQTRTQMISGTGFSETSHLSSYLLLVSIQQ